MSSKDQPGNYLPKSISKCKDILEGVSNLILSSVRLSICLSIKHVVCFVCFILFGI